MASSVGRSTTPTSLPRLTSAPSAQSPHPPSHPITPWQAAHSSTSLHIPPAAADQPQDQQHAPECDDERAPQPAHRERAYARRRRSRAVGQAASQTLPASATTDYRLHDYSLMAGATHLTAVLISIVQCRLNLYYGSYHGLDGDQSRVHCSCVCRMGSSTALPYLVGIVCSSEIQWCAIVMWYSSP